MKNFGFGIGDLRVINSLQQCKPVDGKQKGFS